MIPVCSVVADALALLSMTTPAILKMTDMVIRTNNIFLVSVFYVKRSDCDGVVVSNPILDVLVVSLPSSVPS